MSKRTRIAIAAALLLATVALTIAGAAVLPASVGMQITTSGETDNFMPKWAAVALPAAVGGVSAVVYAFRKINVCAFVSAVMVVAQIVTLVIN